MLFVLLFSLVCICLNVPDASAAKISSEVKKLENPIHEEPLGSDSNNSLPMHSKDEISSMYYKSVMIKDTATLKQLLLKWPQHATGENYKDKTLLRIAIKGGSSEIVKMLLESNTSDIDRKDKNGFTPLMSAAVWANYDIVKLLVSKGADLDIQDNMGNTAIFRAIFTHNDNIFELLIKSGANVDIRNSAGMTPRMMVEKSAQGEILRKHLNELK